MESAAFIEVKLGARGHSAPVASGSRSGSSLDAPFIVRFSLDVESVTVAAVTSGESEDVLVIVVVVESRQEFDKTHTT